MRIQPERAGDPVRGRTPEGWSLKCKEPDRSQQAHVRKVRDFRGSRLELRSAVLYRAPALNDGIASRRNIELTSSTAIRMFPLPHHINSPNKPPPMNCETPSMGRLVGLLDPSPFDFLPHEIDEHLLQQLLHDRTASFPDHGTKDGSVLVRMSEEDGRLRLARRLNRKDLAILF
jgi:hypothetical protein